MSKINIGNKLLCDNDCTYTVVEGDVFYEFGLADESGKIVDYVAEGHLEDCLPFELNEDDCDCQSALCVDIDENGLFYMENKDKIILDLCGGTGSWSRPYQKAGYDVRIITLPEYDVTKFEPPKNVYGILAAPPCTEFSVLNCIAEPRKRNEDSGMEIVNACLRIIEACNPKFWALENPVGHLRKYLGKPKLTFQPWEYGDAWTKRTDIWGNYKIPEKTYKDWESIPKLELYVRPNRDKPNFAFLHKSAWKNIPQLSFYEPKTDAEFRAMTPPAFAEKFFENNK